MNVYFPKKENRIKCLPSSFITSFTFQILFPNLTQNKRITTVVLTLDDLSFCYKCRKSEIFLKKNLWNYLNRIGCTDVD